MTHRVISATPILLLALVVAAPAAFGADLSLSLGGAVEYDDNVFRRSEGEEDDILFRLQPGVRIEEEHGEDLNFSVGYSIPFEFALDFNDELRDEDHIADGNFVYHLDEKIQFFGSDRFAYLRSGQQRAFVGSGGTTVGFTPDISSERNQVTDNAGELGMVYAFSPRTKARVVASSDFFDPDRDDRSRVYSVGGLADLTYRLSLKHQVGGGAGYTYQEFDDRDFFAGSETDIYRAFASWRWFVDDTMSLEISGGPSYLRQEQNDSAVVRQRLPVPFQVVGPGSGVGFFRSDGQPYQAGDAPVGAGSLLVPSYQSNAGGSTGVNCAVVEGQPVADSCSLNIILDSQDANGLGDALVIDQIANTIVPMVNGNPAGDSSSNLTIFAQATLVKNWSENLESALNYTRSEGNASGLGSTVVADAASLSTNWRPWDLWEFSVRGDWVQRESAFDSEQTFDRVFPLNTANLGVPVGIALAGVCAPGPGGCAGGTSFNSDTRSTIDTVRWSVQGRFTHRLFRGTRLYGLVRYDDQESERRSLGKTTDFENTSVIFGVVHIFEPIKLW